MFLGVVRPPLWNISVLVGDWGTCVLKGDAVSKLVIIFSAEKEKI